MSGSLARAVVNGTEWTDTAGRSFAHDGLARFDVTLTLDGRFHWQVTGSYRPSKFGYSSTLDLAKTAAETYHKRGVIVKG